VQRLELLVQRALGDSQAPGSLFYVLAFGREGLRDVKSFQFLKSPIGLIGSRALVGTGFEGEIPGLEN